jgi:uncharacterized protein (DUF849 family)
MLERGRIATSNGQLVERMVEITRLLQREPMAASDVPAALKLSGELLLG